MGRAGSLTFVALTLAGCLRHPRPEIEMPAISPADADSIQEAFLGGPTVRFKAVHKLAVSDYSEEAAVTLADVVADRTASETTRDYAAMGLRNFTTALPASKRQSLQTQLRNILESECEETPDGIIRTLIAWGDADFICEILGDKLHGHALEIEVLVERSDKTASERLWDMYESCPKSRKAIHYNQRAAIGRALVNRRDIRGVDILMALLPPEAAPGPQSRTNIFLFLTAKLGNRFGYDCAGSYTPTVEPAIQAMLAWWEENHLTFSFDDSQERQ